MTTAALLVGSVAAALAAAVWAGLLSLAEEAPALPRTVGDPPTASREAVPLYRAIQISRLALLMLAGVAASAAVSWWDRPWVEAAEAAFLTGAFLYLVADALPRGVGVLVPRLAMAAAPVARRSLIPFRPLLGLVAGVERRLQFLFPPKAPSTETPGQDERDMLAAVLSLRDGDVAEAMTPRLDVVAVEAKAEWREVVELLRRSEHARLPVYDEDLDDIVGILYAKDLTPAIAGVAPRPANWQELVRPGQFVPESKSLAVQLRDFQRGPAHLAIVVDEFGGTSGLVTLEDILEEVVGEIHGEYDRDEEPPVVSEGNDRFWVDGTVTLDTLSDSLRTTFDRDDVSTVGGLVYSELGRVPRPGEELQIGRFRVVVEQVVRRRIRRVYFERQGGTSSVEAGWEDQP